MIELTKLNRLLDDGFSVITVGDNKRPNYTWSKYQNEQITKEQLEKQYNYQGGYFYTNKSGDKVELPATKNAGIVTGYYFLEVIDVDLKVFSTAKEQKEFWDEYLSFLKDNIYDFDDKFVITKTQNDGYHILYRTKRVEGNLKIAKLKGHKECVIETRGKGGYVFIYDKFLNNKNYSDVQFITDEEREILMSISNSYNYVEPKKIEPINKVKKEYEDDINAITPWDDFNNRNTVLDVVQNDFDIVRNLKDKYIIKRFGATSPHSGYIYKDNDVMYLFSTGTDYPHETPLTPYACYTYKNCNGDFSLSASNLYKEGYGTRKKVKTPEVKEKIKYEEYDFPIDIFPEPIQRYILECNDTLDSIVDYMGSSLIWMLSVCVGNSFEVEVKAGWREKPSVWIANVGKAGLGKTPSIKNIIFPLKSINAREIKQYIKDRKKFDEFNALPKNEKDKVEQIQQPKKSQFIANDITIEALIDLHEQSKNAVGVFKDELAGWFKDMNKYKEGSDLEFWLSSWSGESVNVNRITRVGSFVENPFIPVLGGIQPSILNRMYTEENKDNGFIDRILLAYPEAMIERYNDKEMNYDTISWYNNTMINFFNLIKYKVVQFNDHGEIEPVVLFFDDEAKVEWKRIFNEITDLQNSEDENEYMKSMYPKQKSYIPRFALLIYIFDCYINRREFIDIDKESMLKAEKLSKYFISMSKKVKIHSIEESDMKTVFNNNKSLSNYEKIKKLYSIDPEFNRKKASEALSLSRRTITNYLKKLEK